MYRHVLFDVDGTMLDSEPYFIDCLIEVCRRFSTQPFDSQAAHRCFSMNSHDAMRTLGVDEADILKAVAAFDKLCFQEGHVPIYDGIPELLTALRADGAQLAIYSARFAYEFDADPSLRPLIPFFDEIIGIGSQPSKPDPAGVLDYMQRHGLEPKEVLYIGDSYIDSLTAQRAGIDFVLCEWKSIPNTERYPARYYCSRPAEILAIWQQNRAAEK